MIKLGIANNDSHIASEIDWAEVTAVVAAAATAATAAAAAAAAAVVVVVIVVVAAAAVVAASITAVVVWNHDDVVERTVHRAPKRSRVVDKHVLLVDVHNSVPPHKDSVSLIGHQHAGH